MNLEDQLIDDVTKILGPNGLLVSAIGGGMTHHKDQFDFAIRAAQGFCRHDTGTNKASINMLQAGTGTGKTIAYLVPLMLYAARTGERVAVSTFTRQLQNQITSFDGLLVQDWVQKITGQKLLIAKRVGLSNYVSIASCERLISILENDDNSTYVDAIAFLEDLIEWLTESVDDEYINSGILDDFLSEKNLSSVPFGVKLSMIELTRQSPTYEFNRYNKAVAASKSADVLIINHALLIVNAYRFSLILDSINERPISALVCDEADQLPSVAESMLSAELPLHKLSSVVSEFGKMFDNEKIVKKVNNFYDYVMKLKPTSKNVMTISENDEFLKQAQMARGSLLSVEKEVSLAMNKSDFFDDENRSACLLEFVDVVNDLQEFCKAAKSKENSSMVSWSPIREFPTLRICQANPGKILGRMWALRDWDNEDKPFGDESIVKRSYLKSALFTSATMATPSRILEKSFDDFSTSIGVIRHKSLTDGMPIHNVRVELFQIYEPAKFGSMKFVLADPSASSPTEKEYIDDEPIFKSDPNWLDYCAKMIETAHAQGKRCLVLTLSFKDTQELAKRLSHLSHLIVHKQGDPLSNVLRIFEKDERAILMSPSAWEGVNQPGMINHLVVTRIPFSPLDTISFEMTRAHLASKGMSQDKIRSISFAQAVNAARRKLAQGLGRPIRQMSDEVTVWIADPRFPYPEHLKDSLDPVFMGENNHYVFEGMHTVIPKRFLEIEYSNAQVCLTDGTVYTPINLGE